MDDLLDDLDELGGSSEGEMETKDVKMEELPSKSSKRRERDDDEVSMPAKATAPVPASLAASEEHRSVYSVTKVLGTKAFERHMNAVETAFENAPRPGPIEGVLEESEEYKLMCDANDYLFELEEEQEKIRRFVEEIYGLRFPELSGLLPHPLEYVRAVRAIGNEMDMTKVSFEGVLSSKDAMNVSVTGSLSQGRALSDEALRAALEGCEAAEEVERCRSRLLQFVSSRMPVIAPNLTAVVGPRTAARLVSLAGGLDRLASIPGCNIKVIGQTRKLGAAAAGYSAAARHQNAGVLYECERVREVPRGLQAKAADLLGNKAALAARVDRSRGSPDGSAGERLFQGIAEKLRKLREPPPAKLEKPLAKPDLQPKKHRGGKRARAWKEKFGMSRVQVEASRLAFGQSEGEYGDSAMGLGKGRLAQGAGGAARVQVASKEKQSKLLGLSKAAKQRLEQSRKHAADGLSSSLVFTPGRGTEMVNPTLAAAQKRRAEQSSSSSYFTSSGNFSVLPK